MQVSSDSATVIPRTYATDIFLGTNDINTKLSIHYSAVHDGKREETTQMFMRQGNTTHL